MTKSLFEDELMAGMEKQLRKQASGEKPSLVKAAECLHAALEIFEEQGMTTRADQVLQLLQKLGQSNEARDVQQMPSLHKLMEAGLTQRDMHEFAKGNPIAKAKFNLVLRSLGYSDHQIGNFIGKNNVMSEEDAKEVVNPNRAYSKIYDWLSDPTKPVDPRNPQPGESISMKSVPLTGPGDTISFKSMAKKGPGRPRHDSSMDVKRMLKNLETYGEPISLADDGSLEVPPPLDMNNLKESDFMPDFEEFAGLLSGSNDSDDLLEVDINDTLEVSENDVPMDDFEDERD